MKFLITGGAGYIGAHLGTALQNAGHQVKIYDDFSNGLERRCVDRFDDVIRGSILDKNLLSHQMRGIDVVVHLAAKKAVGESVTKPDYYFENNVIGSKNILEAMESANVNKIFFSSTAAVYNVNENKLIGENSTLSPLSPYGKNKLEIERFISRECEEVGISAITLRYFNVVGCGDYSLSDNSQENLVPKVFAAVDAGKSPLIYGSDYETIDGTCIRDYVHVLDLINAHLMLLDSFQPGRNQILNIGSGMGYSVKQVINTIEEVIGFSVKAQTVSRREGDVATLVADISKVKNFCLWQPKENLHSMIVSSWNGWVKNRVK